MSGLPRAIPLHDVKAGSAIDPSSGQTGVDRPLSQASNVGRRTRCSKESNGPNGGFIRLEHSPRLQAGALERPPSDVHSGSADRDDAKLPDPAQKPRIPAGKGRNPTFFRLRTTTHADERVHSPVHDSNRQPGSLVIRNIVRRKTRIGQQSLTRWAK